jgi:hypothetical protein
VADIAFFAPVSRQALEPYEPLVSQSVFDAFSQRLIGRVVKFFTQLHLAPRLRMAAAVPGWLRGA